ncbi:MAG: glycosyltransferase family 2 protein [Lachnospiraceae bacterium]|nr:glycosyltransferase family 2 protein [Lachnospiraceae bacterium]
METPLISLIVPVYNTKEYLETAVRSVTAQTFGDWELLLVDDGSTDGSGALCDALAAEDGRIRVFHKPNGGVSSARNLALSEAKGHYLCFLDSDDSLDPAFFETLLAMREKAGDIPVCCGFSIHRGGEVTAPALPLPHKRVPLDDFLFEALIGRLGLPVCCVTWLMPADTALENRFDESLGYGEDSLFATQMLLHYDEVWYDPVPLYHYLTDREGNTFTERSLKKSESRYRSLEKTLELCMGRLPKTEQVLTKHLVECASETARAAKAEEKTAEYKRYKSHCLAWWKQLRRCPDISEKDKIRLLGYGVAPLLSEKVMLRLYGKV